MDLDVKVDDGQVLGAIHRLLALGRNAAPVMRDIAALGENSTRLRFRTETDPDGKKWKESRRLRGADMKRGLGKTLTLDGHLVGSISSNSARNFAEWGVNRIYAAIHQFGGIIKPRRSKYLTIPMTNKARMEGSASKFDGKLRFVETTEGKFLVDAEGVFQYRLLKQVTIPRRSFLGLSSDDRNDILDLVQARLEGTAHAG